MEQLQPRGIGQNRFQYRRVIGAAGLEADEMLVARPVADLDEAELVAQRVQPHDFGIDRDRTRAPPALRQFFFVVIDSHGAALGPASLPPRVWFSLEEPASYIQSLKRTSSAHFCSYQ